MNQPTQRFKVLGGSLQNTFIDLPIGQRATIKREGSKDEKWQAREVGGEDVLALVGMTDEEAVAALAAWLNDGGGS